MTENPTYTAFILDRDNEAPLSFTGYVVGDASSYRDKGPANSNGRWTELVLYRASGGRYVAQEIGRTIWDGEFDRSRAKVCQSKNEIIAFFGYGWLAKQLYQSAGIDCSVFVRAGDSSERD